MAVKRRIPRTGLLRPGDPAEKPLVGRPGLYHSGIPEAAFRMSLLGATDQEMADIFGCSVPTFEKWKTAHPEFLGALRKGKIEADANVAHSLYQRALGYSHGAEKIFHHEGQITRARFTEHYPPETGAAKLWLTNRRRQNWQERIEHAGDPTQPVVFQVIRTARAK